MATNGPRSSKTAVTTEGITKHVKAKDVPRVRDEDFFLIYSNSTNFISSGHDIQILFSRIDAGPNQTIVVRDHGLVAMSPSHCKAFSQALNKQIAEWEKENGEIHLPKPPS